MAILLPSKTKTPLLEVGRGDVRRARFSSSRSVPNGQLSAGISTISPVGLSWSASLSCQARPLRLLRHHRAGPSASLDKKLLVYLIVGEHYSSRRSEEHTSELQSR